jgi:hypothetical protein
MYKPFPVHLQVHDPGRGGLRLCPSNRHRQMLASSGNMAGLDHPSPTSQGLIDEHLQSVLRRPVTRPGFHWQPTTSLSTADQPTTKTAFLLGA